MVMNIDSQNRITRTGRTNSGARTAPPALHTGQDAAFVHGRKVTQGTRGTHGIQGTRCGATLQLHQRAELLELESILVDESLLTGNLDVDISIMSNG